MNKVFKFSMKGRYFSGYLYPYNGGYIIKTTTDSDDEMVIERDGMNVSCMFPTLKGTAVEFEGESIEDLFVELISYGNFSEKEAKLICSHFTESPFRAFLMRANFSLYNNVKINIIVISCMILFLWKMH